MSSKKKTTSCELDDVYGRLGDALGYDEPDTDDENDDLEDEDE